jgi:GNAT superfamily N-acetyltransferase
MIRLQRATHALPADIETLRAEARGEGFRMLDRLARDWASGETRFDRDGEALLVAYSNDVVAGVGGLTVEAAIIGAFRMRRFYIRAAFRRSGVARRLAAALLGQCSAAWVTVNAAPGSEPFWEALGFAPDERDGRTHILGRNQR